MQPVRVGNAGDRDQVPFGQSGMAVEIDRTAVVAPALNNGRDAGLLSRRGEQPGRFRVRHHDAAAVDHQVDGAFRAAVHVAFAEQAARLQAHHARHHAQAFPVGRDHRHGQHHERLLGDLAPQRIGHHRLIGLHGLLEIGAVGHIGPLRGGLAGVQAYQRAAVRVDRQHAVEQGVQRRLVEQKPGHRRAVGPCRGGASLGYRSQRPLERFELAAQQFSGALGLFAVRAQQLGAQLGIGGAEHQARRAGRRQQAGGHDNGHEAKLDRDQEQRQLHQLRLHRSAGLGDRLH